MTLCAALTYNASVHNHAEGGRDELVLRAGVRCEPGVALPLSLLLSKFFCDGNTSEGAS